MTDEEKAVFDALKKAFEASQKEISKLILKVEKLENGFVKNGMAFFEEEKNKADLAALEVE